MGNANLNTNVMLLFHLDRQELKTDTIKCCIIYMKILIRKNLFRTQMQRKSWQKGKHYKLQHCSYN